MQMDAGDVVRGAGEEEIEVPKGGAEGVGDVGFAATVEAIGFAEDVLGGHVGSRRESVEARR